MCQIKFLQYDVNINFVFFNIKEEIQSNGFIQISGKYNPIPYHLGYS